MSKSTRHSSRSQGFKASAYPTSTIQKGKNIITKLEYSNTVSKTELEPSRGAVRQADHIVPEGFEEDSSRFDVQWMYGYLSQISGFPGLFYLGFPKSGLRITSHHTLHCLVTRSTLCTSEEVN
jgi:hypothetical protein